MRLQVGSQLVLSEDRIVVGIEIYFEDVVNEAILGNVEALHHISRDVGRKFQGEVSISSALGDLRDRLERESEEVVELLVASITNAFDHIAADGANAALLQRPRVAHQILRRDATSEDGSSGVLNSKVSEALSKETVGDADAQETVIDEKVAAHQSVDEELLAKLQGRVVREDTFGRRLGALLLRQLVAYALIEALRCLAESG